jgi:hypothetical protein
MLPVILSKRAALIDHPRLVSQLASLERRAAVFGKDRIDHPPNGHDDIANAVAGAFAMLSAAGNFDSYLVWADTLVHPALPAPLAIDPLPWRAGRAALPPPAGNDITRAYFRAREALELDRPAASCARCNGLIAAGEVFRSDGWTSFHYPRCVES